MMPKIEPFPVVTIVLIALFITWYRHNSVHFYTAQRPVTIDDEYDFIVVGGGSAGSVVAARLAEDESSKILLIEAGGFFDEKESFFVPLRWFEGIRSEYDWGYYSEPQLHAHFGMNEQRIYLPRGRVLGGTGMMNGAVYARGSPTDFDLWEESGCEGWGYRDVLPYFKKSEDIQIPELKASEFHGTGGPMVVSHMYETPLTDVFIKAGRELGYNDTDYNGEDISGISRAQVHVKNGLRYSPSLAYLGGEISNNLHISIRSLVTKLDVQNNKAVGVYFIDRSGKKVYVKARKEIVLSAGAINSPKLLMLSGIGPRGQLEELGIQVVADLPVGASMMDHAGVMVHSMINKPYSFNMDTFTSWWTEIQYWFGGGPKASTGLAALAFLHKNLREKTKNKPDVQFEIISLLLPNHFLNFKDEVAKEFLVNDPYAHGVTMLLSPTRLKSRGSVKLRSDDPFDDPKIDVNTLSDENDMQDLISAVRTWEKLMETEAIQELGVDIDALKMSFCADHVFRSDAYWECYIRHLAISMYHYAGTCKMGPETDSTAVVDPRLRVKGISGLRVADASVFPLITSANIQAVVMMVAERAADFVWTANSL